MKTIRDIVLGLLAVIVVVFLFTLLLAFLLGVTYGIGWSAGWLIHLIVGPDIVFGITFEQFMGIMFVVVSFLGIGRASTTNQIEKKVEEKLIKRIDAVVKEETKKYRGY